MADELESVVVFDAPLADFPQTVAAGCGLNGDMLPADDFDDDPTLQEHSVHLISFQAPFRHWHPPRPPQTSFTPPRLLALVDSLR